MESLPYRTLGAMALSKPQQRVLHFLATSIGIAGHHRLGEVIAHHCFNGNVVAFTAVIRALDSKDYVKVHTTQPQSPSRAFIEITPAGRAALKEAQERDG